MRSISPPSGRRPARQARAAPLWLLALGAIAPAVAPAQPPVAVPERAPERVPYRVVGDTIPEPLGGAVGDAARGRAIVADRRVGLCLLCHTGPLPEERFQGELAPSLAGAGRRWSVAQLRLRLADPRRLDPGTVMPAYHRADDEGLSQLGAAWRGRPMLSAQQLEDVVAYLASLRE